MTATPDLLWKHIIEDQFADFLRFFFPKNEADIDFNRGFEFLDKELQQLFPESATSKRYVDKLVKFWLKDGREKWVLAHVEVQGAHDTGFAARMYQYHYRIRDRYAVEVTSIAILTDESRHWKPDRYESSFMGTSVVFRFNTYKLAVKTRAQLLRSGNVFGYLMATALDALKPAPDAEKLRLKVDILKRMLRQGHRRADIREIILFIRYYRKFEDETFYRTFDDEIDLLTNNVQPMTLTEAIHMAYREEGVQIGLDKGVQIGLDKGVQIGLDKGVQIGLDKGREEGETKTARMHIRNMFLRGGFTKSDIMDILQVSPEMTGAVARELFEAGEMSLEALLGCGYSVPELPALLKVEPGVLEVARNGQG